MTSLLQKSCKLHSFPFTKRFATLSTPHIHHHTRAFSSVYDDKQTLWSIFPRMPKKVIIGDVSVRDGFQHEERYVSTEAKKYYLENAIWAGCKNIEVTNLGSPKVMPQFDDAVVLMKYVRSEEFKKKCQTRHIDYDSITFTCVTIREYAVDIALEMNQNGYGPDRCLMMVSTDESHHVKNSGVSLENYWREAESSITKCMQEGVQMCGTVSTIWGSPVDGGKETDREIAYEFVDKWFQLGATSIEHADHDGSASANEVYEYFVQIFNRFVHNENGLRTKPEQHVCHFHELKRGVGSANLLAAMLAGVNHFECTLGGTGGQPTNWMDDRPIRGTGAYYYMDPDPRYVGLICLEDTLVQIDEMGIEHGYDIDKILALGKQMERTLGRRLRSDVIRNGRTFHKVN